MSLPYVVEPMTTGDLQEVLSIEQVSFPRPWSVRTFLSELMLPYTCYRVARLATEQPTEAVVEEDRRPWWRWWLVGRDEFRRPQARGPVVGYAGLQALLGEGHIMTLAVHLDYRRRGIGELLLLHLFDEARDRGVSRLTLEVRVSNEAAQSLYRKYGFRVEGRRRRYYSDGETALIMWTGQLDAPESQALLEQRRARLLERLAGGEELG